MTASRPPLRVALAIFRLSPAGGLEQHALRLATLLAARGCEVTLITTKAPMDLPPAAVRVEVIPARGRSNHGRLAVFAADAARAAAGFDRRVAFHAIPGFDLVFCADPSRARPRGWSASLPRYRTYARLERAAFAPDAGAVVLCLSSHQRDAFIAAHAGSPERFVLLSPTVDAARVRGPATGRLDRAAARRALRLDGSERVWLWMGLQPRTKGLDRVLRALARAPGARLVVCGLSPGSRGGRAARRLARRLGVEDRTLWLGFVGDSDLGVAMAAADVLVHPSRADVTGTVILEALAAGLPVITTAVCGYGEHVRRAGAGTVLAEPFAQADLDRALANVAPQTLADWSAKAAAYGVRDDLFRGLDEAAALISENPPRR